MSKQFFLRLCCVILYFSIVAIIADFNITILFNLKEFILIIIGGILLTISFRPNKTILQQTFSQSLLFSGIIATIIFLLTNTDNLSKKTLSPTIALMPCIIQSLRPLLYGVLLSYLFHNTSEKTNTQKQENSQNNNTTVYNEFNTKLSTGDPFRDAGLTKREAQIAKMAASGLTNGEIAESLFISPVTVKTHISNILQKTGFSSRTELHFLNTKNLIK